MATRATFGEISGYPEGTAFASRVEIVRARLHRRSQHGISGRAAEGCDAIVVSGGYRADEDHGDIIVYTGEGGQDEFGGPQVRDQEFTVGNAALVTGHDLGLPVRVIRGSRGDPAWSPGRAIGTTACTTWSRSGVSGPRMARSSAATGS